ncbi:hypothetical protein [Tenacibaculum xiamenense]
MIIPIITSCSEIFEDFINSFPLGSGEIGLDYWLRKNLTYEQFYS